MLIKTTKTSPLGFGIHGEITDIHFPKDKSRKFVFIGYKDSDSAEKAVKHHNRTYIKNMRISVEMCKEDDYKEKRVMLDKLLNKECEEKLYEEALSVLVVNLPGECCRKDFRSVYSNLASVVINKNEENKNNEISAVKNAKTENKEESKKNKEENKKNKEENKNNKEENKNSKDENKNKTDEHKNNREEHKKKQDGNKNNKDENKNIIDTNKNKDLTTNDTIFNKYNSAANNCTAVLTFKSVDDCIAAQKIHLFHGRRIKYKKHNPTFEHDKLQYFKSLFFDFNTVIGKICEEEKINKDDLVNLKDKNLGSRVAILESHLIEQTHLWLKSINIDIDLLVQKEDMGMNKKMLVVRNYDLLNELSILERGKIRVSPSKCLAVVEFRNEKDAGSAYKRLCLKRVDDKAIYCEYLPLSIIKEDGKLNGKLNENLDEKLDGKVNGRVRKNTDKHESKRSKNTEKENKNNIEKTNGNGNGKDNEKDNEKEIKSIDKLKDQDAVHLCESNKIIIKNVPIQANVNELRKIIESQVKVKDIRMPVKRNNTTRGFCFVELEDKKSAQLVCEYFGKSTHLYGRRLVFLPADK